MEELREKLASVYMKTKFLGDPLDTVRELRNNKEVIQLIKDVMKTKSELIVRSLSKKLCRLVAKVRICEKFGTRLRSSLFRRVCTWEGDKLASV